MTNPPEGMSREEWRNWLNQNYANSAIEPLNDNGPAVAQHAEAEPGFFARTRKAAMAAAVAFASAAAPMVILITEDGSVTVEELIFTGITCLGLAGAAFLSTWAVPNAA